MNLREHEHEFDPKTADMGRGLPVAAETLAGLIHTAGEQGYELYRVPGRNGMHIPVLSRSDFTSTGILWFGFVREEARKHYVVAFEIPLTHQANVPKFLEDNLRAEYGDNPRAIYGTMNRLGAMRGNKETAKGRAMEAKHERDQVAPKQRRYYGQK